LVELEPDELESDELESDEDFSPPELLGELVGVELVELVELDVDGRLSVR
jgi:hypothetical protein